MPETKPTWPKRIPRTRAVPALELAGEILDQEADLDPAVEDGSNFETVTLSTEAWNRFVERARMAVGGLRHVDSRPLPAREEPPDYAEAFEAFLDRRGLLRTGFEEAFRAGWNAGRRRRAAEVA
jgi:hypothetical protein